MRWMRFKSRDQTERLGLLKADTVVEVTGDMLGRHTLTSKVHALGEVDFLPPVSPSKIVALGTNFKAHAEEMGKPLPKEPKIFFKPPSALIGHRSAIRLPDVPGAVEYESEVALVVGRRARHIAEPDALSYVFGYTCFNDVTARALQKTDGVFARAKGFDTFAPVGPWIETDVTWENLVVEGRVNGQLRQRAALCDMLFGVPQVLAFISRIMTLLPGDLVVLGTPKGVGPLSVGDQVQVQVESVGVLENPVFKEEPEEERR